jgi:CubicO group peptidase (beta-lactamase class C family)
VKAEDPVPLASLSKAITGLCIAKLVDAGTLSYTDTLSTRLKDYLAANKPLDPTAGNITIAELLRHTSGLVYDPVQGYNSSAIPNTADADVKFAKLQFARNVGPKIYAYNDVNYALLGMIINVVTPDHSYETYCKKVLFTDPLFGGRYAIPRIPKGTLVLGAFGGWEMSTVQYSIFISTNFRKLSPKAEQFMRESETFRGADGKLANYGLGVGVFATTNGKRRIQHFGDWRGGSTTPSAFSTYFALYDTGQLVVVATPDVDSMATDSMGKETRKVSLMDALETVLGTPRFSH